jgi:glycosyltransferase involved in cell wall biosynthesis
MGLLHRFCVQVAKSAEETGEEKIVGRFWEAYAAVIPTTGQRPEALWQAVMSVSDQTAPASEIVVVLDSDSADREEKYRGLRDLLPAPVQVVRNTRRVRGPASARMCGVQAASAPLVAFLDDDDCWLPEKMAQQITKFKSWQADHPGQECVVLTRCEIRGDGGSYVLPRSLPETEQSAADYLYSSPNILFPSAYVATPSVLCSRDLLMRNPMREDLLQMEDIEWLIRVTEDGAGLVYCEEVLTIVEGRGASRRGSQSTKRIAVDPLLFAREFLCPIEPRYANNYTVTYGVKTMRAQQGWAAAMRLLGGTILRGNVGIPAVVTGALQLAVPERLPRPVRLLLHQVRARRK